jgi:hypothetical protein
MERNVLLGEVFCEMWVRIEGLGVMRVVVGS